VQNIEKKLIQFSVINLTPTFRTGRSELCPNTTAHFWAKSISRMQMFSVSLVRNADVFIYLGTKNVSLNKP